MNNGERSVSFFKRCAAIKNQLFAVELLHISEINTFDKARMMRYASQAYRYDIVSVINFLTNTIKKATPTVQHTNTRTCQKFNSYRVLLRRSCVFSASIRIETNGTKCK